MKTTLFSLLILCSFALTAQDAPSIELKPSSSDSARWKMVYTFQGSEQTATTAWDTLPNIVSYGEVLYRSGGFIGAYRVEAYSDLITPEVETYVFTQGIVADPVRQVIASEMIPYGSYPISRDTSVSYPLIGTYLISGASCGMPADTMEISISPVNSEIVRWHEKDNNVGGQGVFLLGEGVISVYSDVFGEQVTAIQQDSVTWRMPHNCVWTKLD